MRPCSHSRHTALKYYVQAFQNLCLDNHSSESFHIWTIDTLEGQLSFHDPWPQVGLEVKSRTPLESDFLLSVMQIQATPAMSTSRISILPLMSKWYFIPNIFYLYIFAFQLHQCRKRLTWSNGYLEVIFHDLDVFSIIFATSYVEVKNQRSHRRSSVCFSYEHVLSEVRKSSKQKSKTKWYTIFRLSN